MTSSLGSCNICFEDNVSLLQTLHTENSCGNYKCCEACAFTYLSHKILEKDVSSVSLTCPVGCKAPMTSFDVHRIILNAKNPEFQKLRPDLLSRFDEAMKAQSLIDTQRDQRLQRRFPSITETASDIALSCWSVSKDTRRCPGCRNLIEKNGGCQHMTCRSCKHRFWWCCGTTVGKSHSEVLCFPIVYMNHQHRYWGPNILVRAVTKTTVAGVGIGVGCAAAGVAVVAVPTYFAGKLIDEKAGWADRRRQKERERREKRRIQREQERMERHKRTAATREAARQRRIENGEDPDPPRRLQLHSSQSRALYRGHMQHYHAPWTPDAKMHSKFGNDFKLVLKELHEEAAVAAFDRELNRALSQPVVC
jgi:hypothetical protein